MRGGREKLQELRRLSAAWPEQLDIAARNLALADADVKPIEPALLQQANRTLGSLMDASSVDYRFAACGNGSIARFVDFDSADAASS